jgi:hypothetical protein
MQEDTIADDINVQRTPPTRSRPETLVPESTKSTLFERRMGELNAMVLWASTRGVEVPQDVANILNSQNELSFRDVEKAHRLMAAAISPALPYSVAYIMERESGSLTGRPKYKFLASLREPQVPLLRNLMLCLLFFLIALPVLLIIGEVTDAELSLDTNITEVRGSVTLALTFLFFIAAAGIGASFESLFRAMRYVEQGTYLPDYEFTYWARIFLGLGAGLILAGFVEIGESGTTQITKTLLAILGGFSAIAVYRILRRLVDTVEALIGQDARRSSQAELDAAMAKAENVRRQDMLTATVLASQLKAKLDQSLAHQSDDNDLKKTANQLLELLQGESAPDSSETTRDTREHREESLM